MRALGHAVAVLASQFLLAVSTVTLAADVPPTLDAVHRQAAAQVARMTLDEKVSQLINVSPEIKRLEVPFYSWWTESLRGAIGPVNRVGAAIGLEVRGLHAQAPGRAQRTRVHASFGQRRRVAA